MHFYTSVNNNYMAKAIVLAKSVKKYMPDAKFSIILSDRNIIGKIKEKFSLEKNLFDEVLTLEQLDMPVDNLNLWIFEHTVVELCTAVKGQALVKFLLEGSDKVVYLDPDIEVFDNLKEINHLLDKYDILLTPHQTIPEKTMRDIVNNECSSLTCGTYNFGFYAVKNSVNGIKFAKWWRDRLLNFCYDNVPAGLFVDQKWGNLVPAMFNKVCIMHSPAYNVATWNLSNRSIETKHNKYLINGEPLQFFHFSGFDSGKLTKMIKLYARPGDVVFTLIENYTKELQQYGQDIFGKLTSIYDRYDNSDKINKSERFILRRESNVLNYFKDTNPYITDQKKSYYHWYRENVK